MKAGVLKATFDLAFAGIDHARCRDDRENGPAGRIHQESLGISRFGSERDQVATGAAMRRKFAAKLANIEERYGVDSRWFSRFGASRHAMAPRWATTTLSMRWRRLPMRHRAAMISGQRTPQRAEDRAGGPCRAREMIGSWAGAMGHTQFMPSSWKTYAADYDNDGKRDIWTNIGRCTGLDRELPCGTRLAKGRDLGLRGRASQRLQRQACGQGRHLAWRMAGDGRQRVSGGAFPRQGDEAVLKLPAGPAGHPSWC